MANNETITINVKAIADMSDVLNNTKQIQNALNQLKLPTNLKTSFGQTFNEIEKEASKIQTILTKPTKTKGDITGLEKSFDKVNTLLVQLQTNMGKIDPNILKQSLTFDTKEIKEATDAIIKIQQELSKKIDSTGLQSVIDSYNKLVAAGSKSKSGLNFIEALKSGDIKQAQHVYDELGAAIERLNKQGKNTSGLAELHTAMSNVLDKANADTGIQKLVQDLEKAQQTSQDLANNAFQKLNEEFERLTGHKLNEIIQGFQNFRQEQIGATKNQVQLNSELDRVKSRIQYFFGLNNAINLFRRAVRDAFNTVKELDAAMTETAVVTDYSVGDMWSQLPRYTKVANELGVTTKGAYETMTLFYQQGLDTNQAFALGTETMKMARIAGLDYKDATDAMTAALRGFNMELNEMSAQRVNDVYSQLAAKTASNVEEISTAMTKTASIANNAGMEFETTAAYLSQIIETTREAPETAGTALALSA